MEIDGPRASNHVRGRTAELACRRPMPIAFCCFALCVFTFRPTFITRKGSRRFKLRHHVHKVQLHVDALNQLLQLIIRTVQILRVRLAKMGVPNGRAHDGFGDAEQRFQHTPRWLSVPRQHAGVVGGFHPKDASGKRSLGSSEVVAAVKVERIPQDVITSIFVVSHRFVLLLPIFIRQQMHSASLPAQPTLLIEQGWSWSSRGFLDGYGRRDSSPRAAVLF